MKLLAQQMEERRERILAAARETIGERGYAALTMRDLARASRVTVPTIYNLVGGKEDVLLAAVADQTERFVAAIDQVDADTAAGRLARVIDASGRELLRAPRYYRALVPLLFGSQTATLARQEVERALSDQLNRGLADLERAGDLAEWADPDAVRDRLMAHMAFTSLQWAGGQLGREAFRAASLYEAALLLMGVTRGASRAEFERMAADVQERVVQRRSTRAAGALRTAAGGGA